jgi:hypothetical protein
MVMSFIIMGLPPPVIMAQDGKDDKTFRIPAPRHFGVEL